LIKKLTFSYLHTFKTTKKTLLCSLLFVITAQLLAFNTYALDPSLEPAQYHHQRWSNENGLPQNTINSITQTTDGYLWLGTLEGLVRFDGISFTNFNARNTMAIDHNIITAAHTDKNGSLWFVNSKGSLIKVVNNQFERLSSINHLSTTLINTIYPSDKGVIWIGTNGNGLIKYQNHQFTSPEYLSVLGSHIRKITENIDGLWVASDKGLFLITNKAQVIAIDDKTGLESNIKALYSTKENLVLVGTDKGLIYVKNNSLQSLSHIDNMQNNSIEDIIEDSDKNIWLATDGQGLIRIQHILSPSPKTKTLFNNQSIYSLFEDREKILWVGSHLDGLYKLKDPRVATYSRNEGLSHHLVRSVIESSSGSILIGTEGGGINEYKNRRITPYSSLEKLSNLKVYSMIENADKSLWIGSDQGIFRTYKDSFDQYTVESGLSNNIVLALHQATGGDLWVGTYAGGLNILTQNGFKKVPSIPALNETSINVIYEDSRGVIWIGTRGKGLVKYSDNNFTTYTIAEGLSDNMVFSIHEDSDGYLWVGTYGGGLNRLKDNVFAIITEDHGLYDNVIHKIVEDNSGRFWISSNRGIFNVSKDELNATINGVKKSIEPIVYGIKDGMRNAECNGGNDAGLLTSQNEVWFPTIDGVIKASRLGYEEKYFSTPILINKVLANDLNISKSKLPNIGSDINNLSISYTSPSLYEPEALEFRYKLKGIDDDWIYAKNRRTAHYGNIPAGKYTFSVQVKTTTTDWENQQSSITILVSPQYYETVWFKLLLGLLTIAIIYLAYRVKVTQLKRRNRDLENAIQQRTAELQKANISLNQLAREDGLTEVINRRAFNEILEQECDRAKQSSSDLCLLLIDIDYFKQYNDALGHLAGDECLINIAAIISQTCNQSKEAVARYGGDEFAVILPMIDKDSALALANKICHKVLNQAISHPNSKVAGVVSVTVGVGSINDIKSHTAFELISSADKGLYNAKNNGKNQAAHGH
jgi:diguanylate cyclase (GGDEF)-like protein